MPKLKNSVPKLSRNGDHAVVYAGKGRVYLGKYGTEEAAKNYRVFIAEWAAVGEYVATKGEAVLVDELVLAFIAHAKKNIGQSDFGNYKKAAETMLGIYSGIPVDRFGPKSLAVVQKQFEGMGYARSQCNKLTNFIKTMFRWGVSIEMVPAPIADALKYVQPLRRGRTIAHDNEPRQDVPSEVIDRTLPHLMPTVAAMVQVQRLTAMRPNEVFRMQAGDIDTSGEIWIYRPGKHKGSWRGHDRTIALGKLEQDIIRPRLVGKSSESAVFSPKDTLQEKKESDTARRKTSVQPSQQKRAERAAKRPKSRVREFYDAGTYARSVKKSIELFNANLKQQAAADATDPIPDPLPHWTPYQIRHTAVTEITKTEGLDVARAVAGQKTINVTKMYNHSDLAIAIRMAEKRSVPAAPETATGD